MNSVPFSINHHFKNSGNRIPPLTATLDLIERCACWPPPTRKAVIGLWSWETGLEPGEFWDVAAALLKSQEVAE